jgi:hypothetical protein
MLVLGYFLIALTLLGFSLGVFMFFQYLRKKLFIEDFLSATEQAEITSFFIDTLENIRETLYDLKLTNKILYAKTLELHNYSSKMIDFYHEFPDAITIQSKNIWKEHTHSILVLLNKYIYLEKNSAIDLKDQFQEKLLVLIDKLMLVLQKTHEEINQKKSTEISNEIQSLKREMDKEGF